MTDFIKDYGQLKKYMPNLIQTVEGEDEYCTVLEPHIVNAEQRLATELLGQQLYDFTREHLDEDEYACCREVNTQWLEFCRMVKDTVVCDAWVEAIPSMDLTLLPGGNFMVSQNNSHAVASGERVNRLIKSLENQRDKLRIQILDNLYYAPDAEYKVIWEQGTTPFLGIGNPFSSFMHLVNVKSDESTEVLTIWRQLHVRLMELNEARTVLAEDYIGTHAMNGIIKEIKYRETAPVISKLINDIRNYFNCRFDDKRCDARRKIQSIINDIDHLRTIGFEPRWMSDYDYSPIQMRRRNTRFNNKKDGSGYWF